MDLKSFDWRSLKKYLDPRAADDLNRFLERMPQTAGQTVLVAAAIAWAAAGIIGLYTTMQVQKLTELRIELQEASALQPPVPKISSAAVSAREIENFAQDLKKIYRGLDIRANGNTISLSAKATTSFPEFREAVGHLQNGGKNWDISITNLCVGRECAGQPLSASFRVNRSTVSEP